MIESHLLIILYKVIFYGGLSKQFFLDAVTALISSMSIDIGKWNQKSYEKSQQVDMIKLMNGNKRIWVYHLRTIMFFCLELK